jgi:hypothetical protein
LREEDLKKSVIEHLKKSILCTFLAHLAKGNVSFCHHLASVVRHLSVEELPMAAMFVNGSGQNEQSLERTFHRCFLPSFTSFS